MIVAVTGGRNWNDPSFVGRCLWSFHDRHVISELHEGGADGWDSWCRQWARSRGIDVFTYWYNSGRGKAGGPYRNGLILDRAKPKVLLAGPGGHGTANMIRQAEERGIKVIRFEP